MLERIRKIFTDKPDRTAFFGVIERYFPKGSNDYLLIENAYNTAKDAFRDELREGGERYFEHLRCVALILMVYLRVRDANVIAAALLHDIVEDIKHWSQERVATHFNQIVGELVWWVSKPPVANFDGDKEARNRAFHQNLSRASRGALLIKLADRLHNLLTLWDVPVDKQRRKISETQDYYLPIAEKETILIHEIEAAMAEVTASWKAA